MRTGEHVWKTSETGEVDEKMLNTERKLAKYVCSELVETGRKQMKLLITKRNQWELAKTGW